MSAQPHSQIQKRMRAFTLIEMLVVLAILTILSGIGLSFFFAQREEAKKDKARGDMQVIQLGLEAYRARFGDYPRFPSGAVAGLGLVDTNEEYLLNALFGKIGPTHQEIRGIPIMLNSSVLSFAKRELPMADLADVSNLKENWIIDPWGTAYKYDDKPKNAAGVLLFGYELISAGPDGDFDTESDNIAAQ